MAARGIKADEIATVIGASRRPVFAKLGGSSPWKAYEVQALAEHFDVSIADLFAGLGLLGNDEAPRSARPRGSDIGCAIRDSNPGPAD